LFRHGNFNIFALFALVIKLDAVRLQIGVFCLILLLILLCLQETFFAVARLA
jgi:hypothetical protein